MALVTFPLERVLKHRERGEQAAELARQRALAALLACEAQVADLLGKIDATALGMAQSLKFGGDLTNWLAGRRQTEHLGRQQDAAKKQQKELTERLQAAITLHQQAARAAEALRQLKEQHLEKHRIEAAKREQILLDEMSLRRSLGARD